MDNKSINIGNNNGSPIIQGNVDGNVTNRIENSFNNYPDQQKHSEKDFDNHQINLKTGNYNESVDGDYIQNSFKDCTFNISPKKKEFLKNKKFFNL